MPGILSVETMGLHMHPQDSMRARVKVLRNFSRAELQRALELATACSLTFPGYGYRRTVMTIRTTLDDLREKTR